MQTFNIEVVEVKKQSVVRVSQRMIVQHCGSSYGQLLGGSAYAPGAWTG